jgi:hypothetical protein
MLVMVRLTKISNALSLQEWAEAALAPWNSVSSAMALCVLSCKLLLLLSMGGVSVSYAALIAAADVMAAAAAVSLAKGGC